MFPGQKDQAAGRDSRSADFRECHFCSRLWHHLSGRTRSGRQQRPHRPSRPPALERRWLSDRAQRQQLLQAEHAGHTFGLPVYGTDERRRGYRQRTNKTIAFAGFLFLLSACGPACSLRQSPQAAFADAYKAFVHGDLTRTQEKAHQECARFRDSNPEWSWKFRILEGESLLWQGMYPQALATVDSQPPGPSNKDSLIEILAIEGVAHARLHQFPEAEEKLGRATQMCQASPEITCGDVIRARGVLAVQHGQTDLAKQLFEQSL